MIFTVIEFQSMIHLTKLEPNSLKHHRTASTWYFNNSVTLYRDELQWMEHFTKPDLNSLKPHRSFQSSKTWHFNISVTMLSALESLSSSLSNPERIVLIEAPSNHVSFVELTPSITLFWDDERLALAKDEFVVILVADVADDLREEARSEAKQLFCFSLRLGRRFWTTVPCRCLSSLARSPPAT